MTLTIVTDYSKKGSSYRNRHGAYGRTRNGFSVSLHNGISASVVIGEINYYISKLSVNIELNNEEKYSLQLRVPAIEYKILYDFVDCVKGIENFSYKYTGAGEISSVTRKINKHLGR